MLRKPLLVGVGALLVAGATATVLLRAPASTPGVSPVPPEPPLTPAAGASREEWLKLWSDRLPLEASLAKRGESRYILFGGTLHYDVFTAKLKIGNNTGHRLVAGQDLYLFETSTPASSEDNPLQVVGGSFKRAPAVDYAGSVEVRGHRRNEDNALGLIDWVSGSEVSAGGAYDALGLLFLIGGNAPALEGAKNFGEAPPGGSLAITTADLQLSVRVEKGRRSRLWLVAPVLAFGDGARSTARFLYLVAFEQDGGPSVEQQLLAIDMETLLPIVKDPTAPLWKRVVAARAAGQHAGGTAQSALFALATVKQDNPPALRATALGSLTGHEDPSLVDTSLLIAKDSSDALPVRTAAVRLLGRLGDRRATHDLLALAAARELDIAWDAVEALGSLRDPAALEPLLRMAEGNPGELASPLQRAVPALATEAVMDRLIALAKSGDGPRSQIGLQALAKLSSERAFQALATLYGSASKETRRAICEVLRDVDQARAVALLQQALGDRDEYVRGAAVSSLASVSSPEREALMLDLLQHEDDTVRSGAIRLMAEKRNMRAAPRIVAALTDSAASGEVRKAAAIGLESFPGPDATRALVTALSDPQQDVRFGAIGTLGESGDKTAIPALIKSLEDADLSNRGRAATALRKLGSPSACEPLVSALIGTVDYSQGQDLVDAIIGLSCPAGAAFSDVAARLDVAEYGYPAEVARLLEHWTGEDFWPETESPSKGQIADSRQKWLTSWQRASAKR